MLKHCMLVLLLLALCGTAQATTFGLDFNNNSAQVTLTQPLNRDELGSSQVAGRFLYNDDENTKLGSLGLEFVGEPGNVPGLRVGIGAYGYGGSTAHGQDLLAAAVGSNIDYAPPILGGAAVGARIAFAPKIFSGLDTDGLLEMAVRAGYNLMPKVQVFLEYQNVRADIHHAGNWNIDDGLRLGFAARF